MSPLRWRNWVGNQECTPAAIARPADEAAVRAAVLAARDAGRRVRVAATGHSFTPVCLTDGTLLDLSLLAGVVATDRERCRARVRAGTTIGGLGEPLWAAGLALANQGDIDTQQIAGAVSTGTHGSGLGLGSFSACVRAARLVTAAGEVLEIDGTEPLLLRAVQVAVGMLGVLTELELEVAPAYRLRERIERLPYAEVAARFDELAASYRHFSFFWLPADESAALYGLDGGGRDTCYVKLYEEVGPDVPDSAEPGRRVDRSYRIYPGVFEPNFHELEYFVPLERGREAIAAMRELMLARLPASVFPLEVRTTAADDGLLSPAAGTPTTVLSVSGRPGTDYWPYLREVDRTLVALGARVHWGKLHLLEPEQLHARYPGAADFIAIRRRLDPDGVFLNEHLAPLFA